MKKILYLALIAQIAFTACSKKSTPNPTQPTNLTINGTTYSTVVIGSQTWTSVNYNGDGGENYNNGANDPTYGKLYTLAEAQAITLPSGWRLPSAADYNKLLAGIGGVKQTSGNYSSPSPAISAELMSKSGWVDTNGTDQLGFNAQPVGLYSDPATEFLNAGHFAFFLINASQQDNSSGLCFIVSSVQTEVNYLSQNQGFISRVSVRFVKDN